MKRLLFALLFLPVPAFAGGLISNHTFTPAAAGGGDPCSVTGTTVAYRSHNASTAGTTTNKTVNQPSGTTEGDLLTLGGYADSDTWMGSPPTAPTGFQLYLSTSLTSTSPDTNNFLWWKIAGDSEPATYTLTFSNAYSQIYVAAYKNNNADGDCGPFEADYATDRGTDGSYTVEAVNAYANTLELISQANFDGNRGAPPTGWTERFDSGNMQLADEEFATAGSTGDQSGTVQGSADYALHMVGVID